MWYRSDGWIAWKERGKGRVERRRGRRGGEEGRWRGEPEGTIMYYLCGGCTMFL